MQESVEQDLNRHLKEQEQAESAHDQKVQAQQMTREQAIEQTAVTIYNGEVGLENLMDALIDQSWFKDFVAALVGLNQEALPQLATMAQKALKAMLVKHAQEVVEDNGGLAMFDHLAVPRDPALHMLAIYQSLKASERK